MLAKRTDHFVESVIRDMTRLSLKHNAINLAQGFPDFPAPKELKQAAALSIFVILYPLLFYCSRRRICILSKMRKSPEANDVKW